MIVVVLKHAGENSGHAGEVTSGHPAKSCIACGKGLH